MNEDKTASAVSGNSSPSSSSTCLLDSPLCMNESDNGSRKNLTMPYFYLPNPDLDEFLVKTVENFHTPEANPSVFPRRIFEPKDTGGIVFKIGADTLKNNSKRPGNAANCSDYQRMLASLAKLDDSKSPGIKRLVLKDYLKMKIEEKKELAFKRAKELSEIDREIELENEEEIMLESESSGEEDTEEATVSFDEEETAETDKLNNIYTDSLELSKYSDIVNNNDDEDDFVVLKTRKVHILKDDSSNESCVGNDKSDGDKHPLADATELKCKSKAYEDTQINKNIINHRTSNIEANSRISTHVSFYSSDASETSNCGIKDYFQDSSAKKQIVDSYDFAEDLDGEIISSIPSYQPGGGFCQKEDVDHDFNETVTSEIMQMHNKYLISRNSDSSRSNSSVPEETPSNFNYSPTVGLILVDPPISQQESMSDLLSTPDLVNICSGVFKADTPQETRFQKSSGKKWGLLLESPEEKVQDFFDIEAEISGDDDDVADEDEIDCDKADVGLDLVDDHELPSAEELRDEIADLHNKRMRDDEDELLKQIQEKFLDDGELNTYGSERTRKFAWLNSAVSDAIDKERDSSCDSESDEALDETWSSKNHEKAKWLQEADLSEKLCFDYKASKKSHLNIKIIGKPEFIKGRGESSEHLSYKRPQGSFLCMDINESSHVLKRLKSLEGFCSGSRTTKHFIFQNDLPNDITKAAKGAFSELTSRDAEQTSSSGSVFSVI